MVRKLVKFIAHTAAPCMVLLVATACSTTPDVTSADIVTPETPPSPVYLLSDVQGASPSSLEALFGLPGLTRREGAGEYQRYDLSTCALIIILYPDEAGVVRAAHIDAAALNVGEAKPDLNACLAAG